MEILAGVKVAWTVSNDVEFLQSQLDQLSKDRYEWLKSGSVPIWGVWAKVIPVEELSSYWQFDTPFVDEQKRIAAELGLKFAIKFIHDIDSSG